MTYECHFKIALVINGHSGSPTAYLLTPFGSFIRLSEGCNELVLTDEDLMIGEIDSNRDGSYGMPR